MVLVQVDRGEGRGSWSLWGDVWLLVCGVICMVGMAFVVQGHSSWVAPNQGGAQKIG